MSLEFKPTIKSINIANEDLTKITLEIKNNSLDGKLDDLRKLSGKTVVVSILPDSYSYTQQIDRSTNLPVTEWIVNPDGTAEIKTTEQTQLDVDGKGNIDIQEVRKKVDKELVDEYIMAAKILQLPPNIIINPRDVIERLQDGEDLGEIADSYEMSDSALLNDIEKARQYFAPFADFWDEHRDEITFAATDQEPDETPDESEESPTDEGENEPDDSGNAIADSDNETAENQNEDADSEDDEEDPY
ncbi:hypothetical protein [Enterococcus sp. SMC-9]|uniref:hypothetical protein n=1 Tax=Enterococcus sp. SMC-9 TaxID=2862343 RepID=UPI001E40DF60|nr:hypothetical protein [Enterococcus sp. SMC-9]MCD1023491.1 hypothetical protein [Enterococcus sp. SMC-9]